jgi:hypothetical protein
VILDVSLSEAVDEINRLGFAILKSALPYEDIDPAKAALVAELERTDLAGSWLESRGVVYAARNLLAGPPVIANLWRTPALIELLSRVLGPEFGIVRGLYFDKPPERSWSLPWHKDLSIAVVDNSLPSERFSNPTLKAGVPHVVAPADVLERMLTLRIHLDDATDENGPLQVIPGSHHAANEASVDMPPPVTIYAKCGDVLAMRPLLSHASGNSVSGTKLHRRIVHFEFASSDLLPDGYAWHTFLTGN